jgi:hypothetical protein
MGKIRLSLRSLEVDESPPPTGTDIMQLFGSPPDKADRNKEAGLPESADDLHKAFVEATQARPATPPPTPGPPPDPNPSKPSDDWKMTLIDGPEVSHLTLQPEGDPNGPPATQFWKVNGLPANRGTSGSASSSAPLSMPLPTAPDAGKGKPATGTGDNAAPDGNNSNSKPATVLKAS